MGNLYFIVCHPSPKQYNVWCGHPASSSDTAWQISAIDKDEAAETAKFFP